MLFGNSIRNSVLLPIILLSLALPGTSLAGSLPEASDLSRDARIAKKKKIPILLFFSAYSCPYCQEVEELYLEPLYKSRVYAGKVLFRVVRTESVLSMKDFSGKKISHEDFASGLQVSFTPVIRLFNAKGKELSELYGYTSPDYYSWELTETIDESITKLARPKS